jgi:hypothetical protein
LYFRARKAAFGHGHFFAARLCDAGVDKNSIIARLGLFALLAVFIAENNYSFTDANLRRRKPRGIIAIYKRINEGVDFFALFLADW